MTLSLSVIICTYNPRQAYLDRVLEALRKQTLALQAWELIIVDNNSIPAVEDRIDVSWHPAARVVVEKKQGLTLSRLRGFQEAASELFVCVDDDNVLAPDYLEHAWKISETTPFLGAWGGQQFPEYEKPPAPDLERWNWLLALSSFQEDRWANYRTGNRSIPVGAGMCVRKSVTTRYISDLAGSKIRQSLDRSGNSLMSSGDLDLALTACDMGLGVGKFARLQLTHLIPSGRVEPAYLERLAESIGYSNILLDRLRGAPSPRNELLIRIRRWVVLQRLLPDSRRIQRASWRGEDKGALAPLD